MGGALQHLSIRHTPHTLSARRKFGPGVGPLLVRVGEGIIALPACMHACMHARMHACLSSPQHDAWDSAAWLHLQCCLRLGPQSVLQASACSIHTADCRSQCRSAIAEAAIAQSTAIDVLVPAVTRPRFCWFCTYRSEPRASAACYCTLVV